MTALTFIIFMCSCTVPLASAEANIDWEDFEEAISAEDCFGSECGRGSAALSMLQKPLQKPVIDTLRRDAKASSLPSQDPSLEMPAMGDLEDAFAAEDSADAGAISLVQTGASIERKSTSDHKHMVVTADAGVASDMQPITPTSAHDGSVIFAIDGSGDLHNEGMSLVQTEAHVQRTGSAIKEPNALKVRKTEGQSEVKETREALSLMQTDAHVETKKVTIASNGDFEMNPHKAAVPSNGVMHFSLDGRGNFHSEDGESLSLMQVDTNVQKAPPLAASSTQKSGVEDADHPHWSVEAYAAIQSLPEEGISLIQTDAHIMHKHESSVLNADGTLERHRTKAHVAKNGVMHLSVRANGHFHYEI